jgi:predicted PurR-regulated permease PerM
MMRNKQKKSLGFLSVVAFLMILVGVGYTVSSVVATSATTTTSPLPSSELQPQPPQDNLFSSLEKQVATTADSLRNNLLSTLQIDVSPAQPSTGTEQKQPALAVISLAEPLPLPQVYGDISNSAYADAILILYSH